MARKPYSRKSEGRAEALRRRWADPAERERFIEERRQRKNNPAYRARNLEVLKQVRDDPNNLAIIGRASRQRWADPEYRERILKSKREASQRQEVRDKLSAVMIRRWQNGDVVIRNELPPMNPSQLRIYKKLNPLVGREEALKTALSAEYHPVKEPKTLADVDKPLTVFVHSCDQAKPPLKGSKAHELFCFLIEHVGESIYPTAEQFGFFSRHALVVTCKTLLRDGLDLTIKRNKAGRPRKSNSEIKIRKERPERHYADEVKALAIQRYQQGDKLADILRDLKISQTSLLTWRRAAGIPNRPQSWRTLEARFTKRNKGTRQASNFGSLNAMGIGKRRKKNINIP